MKIYITVSLLLAGCGGASFEDAFSTGGGAILDGGDADTAAGGSVDLAAGGHMNSGGASTAGAPAAGGAGTGGMSSGGSGSGGAAPAAGGARVTGGTPGAGGAPTGGHSAGGAGSGGARAGGASSAGGGGAPTAGGEPGAGGTPVPCDGAGLTTHDNGFGQTWQDCVTLGTYDLEQAMKACKASSATRCVDVAQGGCVAVIGYDAAITACVGGWGYGGLTAGSTSSSAFCSGCPSAASGPPWE